MQTDTIITTVQPKKLNLPSSSDSLSPFTLGSTPHVSSSTPNSPPTHPHRQRRRSNTFSGRSKKDSHIIEQIDPFLLVSLRNIQALPRPEWIGLLYVLAFLDVAAVSACTAALVLARSHPSEPWKWQNGSWDLFALGELRALIVIIVASSTRIRNLGWIVGGICGVSTLYAIFKFNLLLQSKRETHGLQCAILISTLVFSQLHWITYAILTADTRRRDRLLKLSGIDFEEERRDNEERIAEISDDEGRGLLTVTADLPPPAIPRNYGSTDVGNNKSDIDHTFDAA
ncbi:4884_t:CDS:2 [Paraglomus occultum]|uniref:4884_t:CDS:1 n=1 Tax=Paraglomus occultum TaxID=144539 RepID=A0A9N9GDC3_9GLOM|nr:4884_t:CDS:2 [Paraglomus occultum]